MKINVFSFPGNQYWPGIEGRAPQNVLTLESLQTWEKKKNFRKSPISYFKYMVCQKYVGLRSDQTDQVCLHKCVCILSRWLYSHLL